MKQSLINVLETICPGNVYLQGTLSGETYPDSFITFWTNDTPEEKFYNNNPSAVDWYFSVIYYSNNPTHVNTVPAQIRTALKAEGFIPQGRGNDIPSDKPTHTGWAMDFIKTETL